MDAQIIKIFLAASITLSQEQIPIGQTFAISIKTSMPKGKGDLTMKVNCEDHCQFLGDLKLLTDLDSVFVRGNSLTLSEMTGGSYFVVNLLFSD